MKTLAEDATVLVREEGPAAFITLNRPDKRNALSLDLIEELLGTLRRVSARLHCSAPSSLPAAKQPPMTAPIDVPVMTSGVRPLAMSVRRTPMCAKPRAALPAATAPSSPGPSLFVGPSAHPDATTNQSKTDLRFVAVEIDGVKFWLGGGDIDVKEFRASKVITFRLLNKLDGEHGFAVDALKIKQIVKPGEEVRLANRIN